MRLEISRNNASKKRTLKRRIAVAMALVFSSIVPVNAARLKDIADVEGVRANQLLGYGLIVGLNGTGDGKVDFTVKTISNMLESMGIRVPFEQIKVKNVAAVVVTADLPPFVRPGSRIDISMSSLGDAKSLQGGTLLFTPLKGADGNTYAVAQGAVNLGGFSISDGGDSAQKNHPTVGTIPQGATVERAIPFDLFQSKRLRIVLRQPDFTTMTRLVDAINSSLGTPSAAAVDSASVEIPLEGHMADPVALVAKLEQVEIDQDVGAKVVVNERTGTIIMGETVTISRVALAHGNLNVSIRSETQVSQPNALSERGETAVVTNSDVNVGEEVKRLQIVGGQVTLGEVVKALNALGATPRDLISIFTALKRAGALNAELIIM